MATMAYAIEDDPQINYDSALEIYYGKKAAIIKKKTFGYDASTQQWAEGEIFDVDLDEQVRNFARGYDQRLFIPRQWTVELREDGIVSAALRLDAVNIVGGEAESIQEKEWLLECDVKNSIVQAWPKAMMRGIVNGWVGAFSCTTSVSFPDMLGASYVDVPASVTDTAISYMQELAAEEFGFKPTYAGHIHGTRHMIGFCKRPLDLNIHQFRHLVGDQYEKLFPRYQRDN